MCPDRQILSVYLDHELPSPWKEKMEAHLAACPSCRDQLARLRQVSAVLRAGAERIEACPGEVLRERIWLNLSSSGALRTAFPGSQKHPPHFWDRCLAVPLPAVAAAAAFLVVFLSLTLIGRIARGETLPDTAVSADLDSTIQNFVPASDMNGVLQYLGREDPGDIMIIRLPESKSFMSAGEPTIIKAADYSRRVSSR